MTWAMRPYGVEYADTLGWARPRTKFHEPIHTEPRSGFDYEPSTKQYTSRASGIMAYWEPYRSTPEQREANRLLYAVCGKRWQRRQFITLIARGFILDAQYVKPPMWPSRPTSSQL